MRQKLENYFEFSKLGTNWHKELIAGVTTFVTMAYIILVNPSILHEAGMPLAGVTAATCVSAAFGSLLMGLVAKYPIALAPGMGLNAYFAYTVVLKMGVPWPAALGAVFLSGAVFLLLTLVGIRQLILAAIPTELYAAVSAGIGLFIAFIGLRNAGLVASHPATMVTLGNLHSPAVLVAIFGLVVITALVARGVPAAILIGIAAATLLAFALGVAQWRPLSFGFSEFTTTALRLDLRGTFRAGFLEIVFVFLFVDLFDNLGTLVAVGKQAGLIQQSGERIPRLNRIFFADSISTMFSSLAGTSTVVSYIESASGVEAGGRSGVTAVVVGLLFLASLAFLPIVSAIPSAATAPALIVVGSFMIANVRDIDWRNPIVGFPAFLTLLMIPLTFSIANGLACGFIAYTLIRLARGEWRQVHWLVYVLTALFIARFIYLEG